MFIRQFRLFVQVAAGRDEVPGDPVRYRPRQRHQFGADRLVQLVGSDVVVKSRLVPAGAGRFLIVGEPVSIAILAPGETSAVTGPVGITARPVIPRLEVTTRTIIAVRAARTIVPLLEVTTRPIIAVRAARTIVPRLEVTTRTIIAVRV